MIGCQILGVCNWESKMGNLNNEYCCSPNSPLPDIVMNLDTLDFKHMDYSNPDTHKKIISFSQEFVAKEQLEAKHTSTIVRILGNRQEHLLIALRSLEDTPAKARFLRSIDRLDLELLDSLYHNLAKKTRLAQRSFKYGGYLDIDIVSEERKRHVFQIGVNAIKEKKVALLLLAGGSSSRFGETKFLKQITLPSKKSILELIFMRLKKTIQLSSKEWPIHVLLMCNPDNYIEIKNFLRERNNCGIPDRSLDMFVQSSIPVVSAGGQVVLDENLNVVCYPRGAGEFLHSLVSYRLQDKLVNELQVRYLCVSGLENVLEKPCDPFLIGTMVNDETEVAFKCVDPLNQEDDFLRYATTNDVVDSVSVEVLKMASAAQQDIRLRKSPIIMNSVVYDFLYLEGLLKSPEPRMLSKSIHVDKRRFTHMDMRDGTLHLSEDCYVFENHLSDLFAATKKISVLKVPRGEEFAPLLTEFDRYSLLSAQKALKDLHETRRGHPEKVSLKIFTDQELQ